jgi:hypothetical protein
MCTQWLGSLSLRVKFNTSNQPEKTCVCSLSIVILLECIVKIERIQKDYEREMEQAQEEFEVSRFE